MGEVSSAQQCGDFERIDLVVLGLAAVNRLHVEGVAEHELDAFASAKICEPVPGEYALGGDREIITVGLDGGEKTLWPALHILMEDDLAVPIENAEVHGLGV
jgi:hypothetical protein